MKYWRGYLVAAILGFFSWALMEFAETHAVLLDMVYPYVSRLIQTFIAQWSGGVDFCLWQFLLIVLAVVALASIVLMIVLKWNPIQWFGWILAGASVLFLLHTGLYGLNYYAGDISEDLRMEVTGYTLSELEEAAVYYRDKANELASQVSRDAQGELSYPDFNTLAQQAGAGFQAMTYEQMQPIFAW